MAGRRYVTVEMQLSQLRLALAGAALLGALALMVAITLQRGPRPRRGARLITAGAIVVQALSTMGLFADFVPTSGDATRTAVAGALFVAVVLLLVLLLAARLVPGSRSGDAFSGLRFAGAAAVVAAASFAGATYWMLATVFSPTCTVLR